MSVAQKTKGEGRFQGNRHEFQGKSNEKFRKPEGKSRLTMDGRCGDTSGNAVEFPILLDAVYRDTYGNHLRLKRVRLYETPNCWADMLGDESTD